MYEPKSTITRSFLIFCFLNGDSVILSVCWREGVEVLEDLKSVSSSYGMIKFLIFSIIISSLRGAILLSCELQFLGPEGHPHSRTFAVLFSLDKGRGTSLLS